MPRKPKTRPAELPTIPAELLESFGDSPMTAEAINAASVKGLPDFPKGIIGRPITASVAFEKALIERGHWAAR